MEKSNMPTRKPLRLQNYDYSQEGAYFLTLCAANRKAYFGKIVRENVMSEPYILLSPYGKILHEQLLQINQTYDTIQIAHYSIMPNHLHMIVFVEDGASRMPPPTSVHTPTNAVIPALVSTLKRFTNRKSGVRLWQRGYYDHILRDENDYLRAWKYIDENPFEKG